MLVVKQWRRCCSDSGLRYNKSVVLLCDHFPIYTLQPLNIVLALLLEQAFVGLAFGYSGSGATLEYGGVSSARSLDDCWAADATLHAAVTLQNVGDAVALVSPPSATLTPPPLVAVSQELGGPGRVGGGSSGGEGEGRWLGLVRESLELMSAVSKRELPATFVAKDLLPKVRCR